MEKLKVLVVDDEPDAIEILSGLLRDSGRISTVHAISDSARVESCLQKYKPDVLFLDIEMPGTNGISVLHNLREYNQEVPVVYVTAYEKYMPDAIKLNVYSYLMKPVDRKELDGLLDRLLSRRESKAPHDYLKKFKLPIKDGYVYLNSEEIFLLEADGNYTRIVTADQKEYVSSYNLGRLVQRIPEGQYLRINRKCVLNGRYLLRINKKKMCCTARVLNREFQFDISRSFISNFNREVF